MGWPILLKEFDTIEHQVFEWSILEDQQLQPSWRPIDQLGRKVPTTIMLEIDLILDL